MVTLVAGATLVTSACQGSENRAMSTSDVHDTSVSTTSSSPSPAGATRITPSALPSVVVPSAANVHSEAGAIAFARFFTAEVDRSFVTLDARFLKARSLPTCEGCAVVIGTIAENHQDDKKQQAPSFRIKGATIEGSRGRTVVLWLPTDVIRVPFHNSQGEANGEVKPQSVTWQVGLDWTDGGWMVSEFAPVAP